MEERDLAFTADELDEYASISGIATDVRSQLPTWPAMASLMATLGRKASLDYLWEEILQGIEPDRREALALVARFETIDDDIVRAAAGTTWSASRIVADLPLVDQVTEGYRLHDLWRGALADVVPPDRWRAALIAGGDVLLGRGERIRAARAFQQAGEFPKDWEEKLTGLLSDSVLASAAGRFSLDP